MFRAGFACLHPEVDAIELSKIAMLSPFLIDGESAFELLLPALMMAIRWSCVWTMLSPGWSNTAIAQVGALDSAKVPVLQEHCRDALQRIGKAALSSEAISGHGERWQCEWAVEEAKDGLAIRSRLSDEFQRRGGTVWSSPVFVGPLNSLDYRTASIRPNSLHLRDNAIFGDLGWETRSLAARLVLNRTMLSTSSLLISRANLC